MRPECGVDEFCVCSDPRSLGADDVLCGVRARCDKAVWLGVARWNRCFCITQRAFVAGFGLTDVLLFCQQISLFALLT